MWKLSGAVHSITHLFLCDQSFGRSGADTVAALLPAFPALSQLVLSNCRIAGADMQLLASAVLAHPHVTRLIINDNPIGTKGLAALLPVIQQRLKSIDIYNCDLNVEVLLHTLLLSQHIQSCLARRNSGVHPDLHAQSVAKLMYVHPELKLWI
jgi:hypothetical protein